MSKYVIGLLLSLGLSLGFSPAYAQSPAPTKSAAASPAKDAPRAAKRASLTGTPALVRIERDGVLRVGVAINAPWVMHDRDGKLMGYSIEVAERFAKAMGWKLQLVETSWANLLTGLRSNDYDVVISGLSITPQRARLVQFSDPIGEFDVDVVVNRGSFPSGELPELARLPQARVGALAGTLIAEFARSGLPAAQFVAFEDETAAIADLREGKLTAYVAEAPLPLALERTYPGQLRVLRGDPLARTAHGLALRVDDTSLLRVLNAWITFERTSGWLAARSAYWFEGAEWGSRL